MLALDVAVALTGMSTSAPYRGRTTASAAIHRPAGRKTTPVILAPWIDRLNRCSQPPGNGTFPERADHEKERKAGIGDPDALVSVLLHARVHRFHSRFNPGPEYFHWREIAPGSGWARFS
jgi:hypothetical protein